jgi:hypothetical protein
VPKVGTAKKNNQWQKDFTTMYELTVSSRKQLERASLRAQAQKPKIEEVGLGMYKVFSTSPATPFTSYATGIFPAKDGNGYDVVCSCPTQRVVCKHAAAIFPHYLMRLKQFADCELEVPTFEAQVQEIKDICAATTTTLVEYTAEMEAKDKADLFG